MLFSIKIVYNVVLKTQETPARLSRNMLTLTNIRSFSHMLLRITQGVIKHGVSLNNFITYNIEAIKISSRCLWRHWQIYEQHNYKKSAHHKKILLAHRDQNLHTLWSKDSSTMDSLMIKVSRERFPWILKFSL